MNRPIRQFIFVLCGVAAAWATTPSVARSQEKLDKNAQFCEDFDQNVIIAGKLDEATKYLNDDFQEHNVRLTAHNLAEFLDKMKALRANRGGGAGRAGGGAGRAGGGGRAGGAAPAARTIFSTSEYVVFMRPNPDRDDPNNPGQKIPGGTHFDIYRLKNGKISEHWD